MSDKEIGLEEVLTAIGDSVGKNILGFLLVQKL